MAKEKTYNRQNKFSFYGYGFFPKQKIEWAPLSANKNHWNIFLKRKCHWNTIGFNALSIYKDIRVFLITCCKYILRSLIKVNKTVSVLKVRKFELNVILVVQWHLVFVKNVVQSKVDFKLSLTSVIKFYSVIGKHITINHWN